MHVEVDLRTLAALIAMHGLLSDGGSRFPEEHVAKEAKKYADALLESLNQTWDNNEDEL